MSCSSSSREGTAARGGASPRSGGRPAAAALPCLNSNNSNEPPLTGEQKEGLNRLSTSHRKTAFALAQNVARLCSKYGIDRIGFLTLTFKDHVTCPKEAGRRFNSLRTGVLASRYVESIAVLERMKSGRIHFHLLVVLPVDIRTGFDFGAAGRGVYTSANAALRAEWAYWRATSPKYRFGRTELMPVKSNEEGLSKYVGKYIAKHIDSRETRDKGVRLVRYSGGSNPCGTKFMFHSHRAALWRWQVSEFARRNSCGDLDELSVKFGKKWAYFHRREIMNLSPPARTLSVRWEDGEPHITTLWDVWQADRIIESERVARAMDCTQADAFCYLYQYGKPIMEFEVPRWRGEKVNTRDDFNCGPAEITTVWSDGRIERVTGAFRKTGG